METLATLPLALHPGTTARILYVNASGATSERSITIERRFTSRNGVTYLRAYCHLRGEDRTFRLDRVLGILNVESAQGGDEPEQRAPAATAPPARSDSGRHASQPNPRPSSPRTGAGRSSAIPGKLFVGLLAVMGLVWLRGVVRAPVESARFVPPPAPPVAVAETTPPERDNAIVRDEYRGQRITVERRDGAASFTLVASGRQFDDMHALRVAVNESLLAASFGVRSSELTELFAGADRDRDGSLSWAEVQAFQNHLDTRYRYAQNDTALWPSQFLDQGGGDCEDWAIVTATLLHFWGIEAKVGLIVSDTGNHAVALVSVSVVPDGFLEIASSGTATSSTPVYVPIDYTHVGGLSNAVGESYEITRIWRPAEIFGKPM